MKAWLTALAALAALTAPVRAADCPRAGTLGVSRVLTVDPALYPRVGTKSFPDTLPLNDKEVVLTFDDGPAVTTPKILAELHAECVKATFFMVGKGAKALPRLARMVAAAGHTVGIHTWSHQHLSKIGFDAAKKEIDDGIAAVQAALGGAPTAPFFRFPYFESTPQLLDYLQSRHYAVFGADFWASDWEPITPDQEFALVTSRLEKARKGIILFHDPQPRTSVMLPRFLAYLREHGYRVVHIVPAKPAPNIASAHS